jgi:hypothetical protein
VIRQPLLMETLITRRMTRQGKIYMFRRPAGAPPNEDLDRWVHKATQTFDFTPLFNGDQQQARWVAQDFLKHMREEANRDGKDWVEVRARLRKQSPYLRRGLQTFFVYYDGKLRSGG